MSTTDVLKSALRVLRTYEYNVENEKGIERVFAAFDTCQKIVQKSPNSKSLAESVKLIQGALESNLEEFTITPWNPPLNTNSFFQSLKSILVTRLQKVGQEKDSERFPITIDCFAGICSLLEVLSLKMMFDDSVLSALAQCLTNIRDNQYSPDNFKYTMLVILFENLYTADNLGSRYKDVCQKLYLAVTTLILQCVLNYYELEYTRFYVQEQGRASKTDLDAKHKLFLNLFPAYILIEHKEIPSPVITKPQLDTLCQTLFKWSHTVFHHVFENQLSDYTLSKVLVQFLNLMNYCIPSVYFRRCARQNLPLLHHLLSLLRTPLFIKDITDYDRRCGSIVTDRIVRDRHYDLVVAAVELVYNLSVESSVIDALRELQQKEKPAILRVLLENSKKDHKHTVAFHCETLIGLMKNDIDEIEKPRELATSCVKFMKRTMNNESQSFEKVRLSDVIVHLKVFIQNEEVKTEVITQDGLTVLTTCATDSRFDVGSVQYPSMELIWSIIFDLSAAQLLRANKVFVDYVIDLTKTKSDEADKSVLKSTAEGVDWQLKQHVVQEEKRKEAEKPVKKNIFGVPVDDIGRQKTKAQRLSMEQEKDFKFDLMISYCHKDGELCRKIHQGLKDNTNARIWIDTEQMYGSLTERMSEAIEHSRIILICYSNAYKESVNCRSECTYANELKRVMIPIRMEANYRPNGWLRVIVGDRLYVDFVKYSFEKAFEELIHQIELHETKFKGMKKSQEPVNASNSTLASQSQKKSKEVKLQPAFSVPKPPQGAHIPEPSPAVSISSRENNRVEREEPVRANSNTDVSYERKQITSWTKEDVHSFFQDKHIDPMLKLIDEDATGHDLHEYYKQLIIQPEPYKLVKEELHNAYNISLPFRMFVTFNKELERFSAQVSK